MALIKNRLGQKHSYSPFGQEQAEGKRTDKQRGQAVKTTHALKQHPQKKYPTSPNHTFPPLAKSAAEGKREAKERWQAVKTTHALKQKKTLNLT